MSSLAGLRRRVALTVTATGLAALIAWPFVAHYRLKNAVARYARELEAQGEQLTVPELAPPLPPWEQNGAPELLTALARLPSPNFTCQPPMMQRVVPGRALVAWRQDPLPNDETTNVWPGLRTEFERHRATLEQIRAALSRPVLVADLDYSQGYHLLQPHLPRLKYASLWLAWGAMLNLHEGRPEDAVANLLAAVRLAGRFKDEPLLISVLVRFAMTPIALAATWEALQSPEVSETALAALQKEWEAVDFSAQIEAALRMERAMFRDALAEMRSSRPSAVAVATQLRPTAAALEELKELAKTALHDPGQGLREIAIRYPAYWAWRWWWSYEDELVAMKSAQAAIGALRALRRDKNLQQALARLDAETARIRREHPRAGRWFSSNPFDLNRSVLLRQGTVEIQRNLVVAAIALRRYQFRHGALPDALEALAPEFCAGMPLDPVNGQPLRYRRLPAGGFLLYSVGENGADDGGDPSPPENVRTRVWWQGRDVVWPQPATAQEAWLYQLETELQRDKKRGGAPRLVATNDLPETVLRELEWLRRNRSLEFTNSAASGR